MPRTFSFAGSEPQALMQIFVSESICGGSWSDEELPASLAREGRAMLEAVVHDLSGLPHVEVVTTWDTRLDPPAFAESSVLPGRPVMTRFVDSPEAERRTIREIAEQLTAGYVIAPEFDRILEQRCQEYQQLGVRLLNSSLAAIRYCADKWNVFAECRRLGIPTLETRLFEHLQSANSPPWLPCVVKRRDGAGSLDMRRILSRDGWRECLKTLPLHKFLVQPEIVGTACSLAVVCGDGEIRFIMPPAEQLLSDDGRFKYLGGVIPAPTLTTSQQIEMQNMLPSLIRQIPGLRGIVGFDFLIPVNTGRPVLVEINPRLTTSYVGYRQLTMANLSQWILNPNAEGVPAFRGSVRFQADGTIREHCG